jgi:hypothetical protein
MESNCEKEKKREGKENKSEVKIERRWRKR